jgi:aspartate 1-decarboxylase
MLRAKIHRATVTQTDLAYVGSLTLDSLLMEATDLREFEKIDVYNIDNGARLTTYVIRGKPGSGVVCLNGAAAHHAAVGHKVIICSYASIEEHELDRHEPRVIIVDDHNRIATPLSPSPLTR